MDSDSNIARRDLELRSDVPKRANRLARQTRPGRTLTHSLTRPKVAASGPTFRRLWHDDGCMCSTCYHSTGTPGSGQADLLGGSLSDCEYDTCPSAKRYDICSMPG